LVNEIRAEIERQGGWISFTRYMEMALYAPGLGYYVAGATKLGSQGDFVTAPEISPLFGRTLAVQVADILAHTGGGVLELGAGSGALALSMLEELQARDRLPEGYRILEVSPELVQRQRRLLMQRLPGLAGRVEWITSLPQRFTGVVVANEVLDALPVHLLVWREEGVRERGVTWKGEGFTWAERSLGQGALRDAAAAKPIEAPYQSEVCIAVPALVRTLAGALDRGVLLRGLRFRGTRVLPSAAHARHADVPLPSLCARRSVLPAGAAGHHRARGLHPVAEAAIERRAPAGLRRGAILINCGIADQLAHARRTDCCIFRLPPAFRNWSRRRWASCSRRSRSRGVSRHSPFQDRD
jgi:hypothetical protein